MKKSIFLIIVLPLSIWETTFAICVAGFFLYWLLSAAMHSKLARSDDRVGSFLLGDSEIEFINLDTQIGTKALLQNRSKGKKGTTGKRTTKRHH